MVVNSSPQWEPPTYDGHNTLHWRHNDLDGVSNHQPYGCLLNRVFGRRSKKTSKLCVTGLCAGNSPGLVNSLHSPHEGPATLKMFPFDDVIMNAESIPMSSCAAGNTYRGRFSMFFLLIMMTSSNGNIFRVTGHLCGKFTGPRWISRTKASDAELWCFFDLHLNKRLSKQPWGWWFETPEWSLWRPRNV